MSIFGKIGHAISGAVKAVGHGIADVGKAVGHGLATVGKDVGLAAEGVVSGFVLKPVAGVVSLFSKDLASKIKLPNQDQVDHSLFGKIGEFTGTALGFVEGGALLSGLGMGATAARATIGAVEGLAGSKDGTLLQKLEGAAFGAVTAGAAGNVGDKVAGWVHKGEDALVQPLVNAGAPNAVTQVSERAMDAELRSLVQTGHFSNWKELLPAAAVSTVVSDAGEKIDHGIDSLMNRLPQGNVSDSVDRFLHAEENSLARTGRFADTGNAISQTIPDNVMARVDRLIDSFGNSNNRFGDTAGQFLHNELDSFRAYGQLVDPRTAFTEAAAREFTPEMNNVIGRVENGVQPPFGRMAGEVMNTEADYLRDYGRLYNPGAALERAAMDQVRPAINHVANEATGGCADRVLAGLGHPNWSAENAKRSVEARILDRVPGAVDRVEGHLPQQARNAAHEMLNGFNIDGANGAAQSAQHSATDALHKYGDRVLPERLQVAEHVAEHQPRVDRRDVRA